MNNLFEIADYGMQYRALSRTGAVLGSQKDKGEYTEEKKAKVPRFVLTRRQKIEARKKALAEGNNEGICEAESESKTKIEIEAEVESKMKVNA